MDCEHNGKLREAEAQGTALGRRPGLSLHFPSFLFSYTDRGVDKWITQAEPPKTDSVQCAERL